MSFGLGGYRIGNGPIHLIRTSVLSKVCNGLEEFGNFMVGKTISIDTAKEILGQFGIKAKKAIQILPNARSVEYCAAHGTAQYSTEGKQRHKIK